jgi:hypothetical protein
VAKGQLNFYIDDSGTRHPDRPNASGSSKRDWFALGGVLVNEADEGECRSRYRRFCETWGITYPLHSADVRHHAHQFRWLESASEEEVSRFMRDLSAFLTSVPAVGLACVIDRPGYNERYTLKYGRNRWLLCKTAFSIAVERAAKYALAIGSKLNVYVERCSKTDDRKIQQYYQDLKGSGAPFDAKNSQKYDPLTGEAYKSVLYDLKLKNKSSPLIQIADMYLWPMCMGGYHRSNKPYVMLRESGRLMDVVCGANRVPELGIKYSCFDTVTVTP